MLAREISVQQPKTNFALLARQEHSGRRRLRYMALVRLKDGKSTAEVALALCATPCAVTRWLKWFAGEGVDRLPGIPITGVRRGFPSFRKKPFVRPWSSGSTAVKAAASAERIFGNCWPNSLALAIPSARHATPKLPLLANLSLLTLLSGLPELNPAEKI
jgi:hypothetical protein